MIDGLEQRWLEAASLLKLVTETRTRAMMGDTTGRSTTIVLEKVADEPTRMALRRGGSGGKERCRRRGGGKRDLLARHWEEEDGGGRCSHVLHALIARPLTARPRKEGGLTSHEKGGVATGPTRMAMRGLGGEGAGGVIP